MGRPPTPSGARCYHCGSRETSKCGFHKGKQRYFCRACRRGFRENPEIYERTGKYRLSKTRVLPSSGYLILELRAIAQNLLGRTPKTIDIVELARQNRANSLNIYRAVFGTFREALRRARLNPKYPNEYDREKMLKELRVLRQVLGRHVMVKDIRAARKKGKVSAIYHYNQAFGSVGKAVAEAGAGKKRFDRWEMIRFLKKLDAAIDRPVLLSDIEKLFQQGKGPSTVAIRREFGSLPKARLMAGIKVVEGKSKDHKRYGKRYTAEELTGQLRSLRRNLGRRPTYSDIDNASTEGLCASATTFARTFDGLKEAYRAAGFSDIEKKAFRYTNEEITAALKMLKKELGRFPTQREINRASVVRKCPCTRTIILRLGKLATVRSRL